MNYCRFALGLVVASGAWLGAAAAHAEAAVPLGTLGLSASASTEVTKDLLALTFSTTRAGFEANAVQAQLKQALDAALAEARKSARPGELEVRTGNFSIHPRYATPAPGKPTIDGWSGSAEIVVEGRDLAAIGMLTGRITTMTVAGIAYRLSRESQRRVESEIAAEAIARYRAQAADYAKQFGYGTFTVREVNVSIGGPSGGPQPMQRMALASSADAGPLALEPGRAVVTATVSGTVQMK